jgi:hypothetical protein
VFGVSGVPNTEKPARLALKTIKPLIPPSNIPLFLIFKKNIFILKLEKLSN